MEKIDSIVAINESKITTIFEKTEKNRIWASHGKNPDKNSTVFRYSPENMLVSLTYASYSPGDTQMILNLYFNLQHLIKVKTVDFDMNNRSTEYVYYYEKSQLINKDVDTLGIHKGAYYVELANRIRRSLKKKPIRFP